MARFLQSGEPLTRPGRGAPRAVRARPVGGAPRTNAFGSMVYSWLKNRDGAGGTRGRGRLPRSSRAHSLHHRNPVDGARDRSRAHCARGEGRVGGTSGRPRRCRRKKGAAGPRERRVPTC